MEEKNIGTIKIAEDVIAQIALKAASEVEGVARISHRVLDNAKEFIANNAPLPRKGIRIVTSPEGLVLTVPIFVCAGQVVPRVAERVQSGVAEAVSSMTGLTVSAVHVTVVGVLPEKPAAAAE